MAYLVAVAEPTRCQILTANARIQTLIQHFVAYLVAMAASIDFPNSTLLRCS